MRLLIGIGLLAVPLLFVRPAPAITLGQIETFQDGNGGWGGGSFTSRLEDGGPDGAGDAYLQTTRPDTLPGSLLVWQRAWDVWGGDYVAAGVNAIEADFINLGASELSIRFDFSTRTPGTTGSISIAPFVVPPDGLWYHARFELSPGHLTPDPSLALRDVGSIRFIHQVNLADAGGTPVIGVLGIDNIRAAPETTSVTLLMVAGLAFVWRRPLPFRMLAEPAYDL